MSGSTRNQLLEVAERLFAARGFYGTSIAVIASEVGLTKQALLHHFGSKEKLYGEVLREISERTLLSTEKIAAQFESPARQLEEMVVAQFHAQMTNTDAAKLIMRELLDNEQRAANAGNWYLKPYLESLVSTAQQCAPTLSVAEALALVYQLLGAAHYFAVSGPTLGQIFGAKTYNETTASYETELRKMLSSRLRSLKKEN